MTTLTKTPASIKKDYNFLCGLELKEFGLNVYLTYLDGEKVQYDFFLKDALLFSGNDFKPCALHNIDDLQTIISLLGFLTLQPGDTHADYFKDYTPAQMEWAKSYDCELLNVHISDFEADKSEYYKEAKEYFKSQFIIA